MKLSRTLEQWAGCDPQVMTLQSPAAMEFAFQDAKHDIRVLAAATAALQARVTELEGVLRRYVAQDIAGDHFHGTKFEASSLHKDARAALNKEPKNV